MRIASPCATNTMSSVPVMMRASTARHDRFAKRKLYQAQGIETVWLVDIERRLVEVWTPELLFPAIEIERLTWQPAGAPEPLEIPLMTLFA